MVHVMSYWKRIHKGALGGALAFAGLQSRGPVMLKFILAIVIILVLWRFGSEDAAADEVLFRAAGMAFVVLLLPLTYIWFFLLEISESDRKLRNDQSAEVGTLNAKIAEIGNSRPNFNFQWTGIWYGGVSSVIPAGYTNITVAGRIVNNGNNSSALVDWSASIGVGLEDCELQICAVQGEVNLSTGKHLSTFDSNDQLFQKSLAPIPSGGVCSGFIMFLVSKALVADGEGKIIRIKCGDVFGNRYKFEYTINGNSELDRLPFHESMKIYTTTTD